MIISLTYFRNYGIAFSIKYKYWIIIGINILLLLAIAYLGYKERKNKSLLIPLIIVFSGGLSNLIERLIVGYVTDYIKINLFNFPIFNLADIYVTIGTIFFAINYIRYYIKNEKNQTKG